MLFVKAATGVIEALQLELDAAEAALRSHVNGHVLIKGHLNSQVHVAKARIAEEAIDPDVDSRNKPAPEP